MKTIKRLLNPPAVHMGAVSLYGDDGIEIMLDRYDDITDDADEGIVLVTGHVWYPCSLEEAHASIRQEYIDSPMYRKLS